MVCGRCLAWFARSFRHSIEASIHGQARLALAQDFPEKISCCLLIQYIDIGRPYNSFIEWVVSHGGEKGWRAPGLGNDAKHEGWLSVKLSMRSSVDKSMEPLT
jgi:hypothetical protein